MKLSDGSFYRIRYLPLTFLFRHILVVLPALTPWSFKLYGSDIVCPLLGP